MRFFCISIYCVYVVSLHTESTDSVIGTTKCGDYQNILSKARKELLLGV